MLRISNSRGRRNTLFRDFENKRTVLGQKSANGFPKKLCFIANYRTFGFQRKISSVCGHNSDFLFKKCNYSSIWKRCYSTNKLIEITEQLTDLVNRVLPTD